MGTQEVLDNEVVEDATDTDDTPVGDMRSDFDAAIETTESTEADHDETADTTTDNKLDEKAEDAEDAESSTSPPESDGTQETKERTPSESNKAEPVGGGSDKPPVGWKADAREAWGAVPPAAQQAIAAREKEVSVLMQNTSESRRAAKMFAEAITPYQSTMQNLGYDSPVEAVKGVMQSADAMMRGTTSQKAAAAAQIIKDFGIDINALDSALVGADVTPSQTQPSNEVSPEMQEIRDFMQLQKTQQLNSQEQARTTAHQEVDTFTQSAEFISDVRMDMADLLDLAAGRNETLSMDDAYHKACMMNPTVSKVIQQREKQTASNENATLLAKKRTAASSVTGNRAGNTTARGPQSITESLNAAWDNATTRRI